MPLLAGIFPSLSPMNREYADLGRALYTIRFPAGTALNSLV